MSAPSAALREELRELSASLHGVAAAPPPENPVLGDHVRLASAFAHLVRVTISPTDLRSVAISIYFPGGYPEDALTTEVSSSTLEEGVVAKLQAGCDKEAVAHKGSAQVLKVVQWLERFLAQNRLLGCFEEVRRVKQLDGVSAVKLQEKSGRIQATLSKGSYAVDVLLVVPDAYPAEVPTITVLSSNFEPRLNQMFTVQVRALASRLCDGFNVGLALQQEADKLKPSERILAKNKGKIKVDLSRNGLQDLKADREFLSQYREARARALVTAPRTRRDATRRADTRGALSAGEGARGPQGAPAARAQAEGVGEGGRRRARHLVGRRAGAAHRIEASDAMRP